MVGGIEGGGGGGENIIVGLLSDISGVITDTTVPYSFTLISLYSFMLSQEATVVREIENFCSHFLARKLSNRIKYRMLVQHMKVHTHLIVLYLYSRERTLLWCFFNN